jgi:pyruvate/2-oxoglutarate dehydrogenase complex dihydrolipoamide dehydrogenase (E3) component
VPHIFAGGDVIGRELSSQMATPVGSQDGGIAAQNAFAPTKPTTVIHEAAMAMRFHAKINDFVELLHVYPTMSEALKIVAISRRKDPAKLSCCAE